MKKVIKTLGIIAILVIIGFSLVACGGDDGDPACTHDWDWTLNAVAATCTQVSKDTATCKKAGCNEINVRNGSIAALGHEGIGALTATCTTDGNTGTGTCTRAGCGFIGTNTDIPALGHDTSGAAATCTTAKICARASCDYVLQAALGHSATLNWSTYNTSTGKVSCTNSGCAGDFAKIGDTGPAGGIIFYRDTEGFKLYQGTNNTLASDTYITVYYLEAWTESVPSIRWSWSNEPTTSPYEWTDVPLVQQAHDTGNPTQWIGYGLRNTRLIISAMSGNPIETNRAVHVASTSKGGKNDWFLPSVDELNAMYIARAEPDPVAGLPTTGRHWSSSQFNNDNAWLQLFDYGDRVVFTKHSFGNVRAVRAF